jgi:hypothetical protein
LPRGTKDTITNATNTTNTTNTITNTRPTAINTTADTATHRKESSKDY